MTKAPFSRSLLGPGSVLFAFGLVACGGQASPPDATGGSGGQGAGPGPTGAGPGSPTLADYLPMVDGSSFTYRHSAGWQDTVSVSSTTYQGAPAFLVEDTTDPDGERSESIFIQSGTQVLRVYKEVFNAAANETLLSQVEYRPGFLRADSAWARATIGVEMPQAYQRTETVPGQGTLPTEDRSHVFVLEAIEDVSTTAGTFHDCLRVLRQRTWQTNLAPGEEGQEKRYWFAPGVGKVQEETLDNGNTEQLEAYTIP